MTPKKEGEETQKKKFKMIFFATREKFEGEKRIKVN
jgi:hypothetical protein